MEIFEIPVEFIMRKAVLQGKKLSLPLSQQQTIPKEI
jgi:hypothetical protein